MKRIKKITALIPCYNEEEGIAEVLKTFPKERIQRAGFELDVIVIDNNSSDKTAEVARSLGATVIHEPKQGKGNAIRTGFNLISSDTDYVVMLDGDSTYHASEILRLVELLESGFATVVLGSRLEGRVGEGSMNFTNKLGNWVFSHLVRYMYGVPVTDVLTGYFAWTREALERLRPHLLSAGFAIEMEMVTKMARLKEDIYCVPISYTARAGESSLRPFYDGSRILLMLIRNMFWIPSIQTSAEYTHDLLSSKHKNIVVVSHYYPPHVGGLEIVAKNQAELLAAAGNKVTVITSKVSQDEHDTQSSHLHVVRVRAINMLERFGVPFPIFLPRLVPTLMRHIKAANVVHIHDAFYMSSFIAALCARWYGKPIVLTQHVEMINHPSHFVMFVQRLVYATTGAAIFRMSTRITTLNDRVEQFLLNRGVQREKLLALSNGVDLEMFHPVSNAQKFVLRQKFGLSLSKKIILFVGRLVPKKGFDKLLAAESDEYQLVFVGGDAPDEQTKKSDNVVFLGKLPQLQVAQVYQAADIFVLPSEGEGFPLSVQEAMATGLPIITSHDEGYRRYNLDKNFIYFLDHPTEHSVRKAIAAIVHDEKHLERMSTYSKTYARSNFAWPNVIAKLIGIYDSLPV